MDKTIISKDENIFEALGFEKKEAANLLIRADLVHELVKFIKENKLSLRKAADFFDVSHSRINDLHQGRLDQFTIDYLVNLISKTGKTVRLRLEEKKAA